MIKTFRHKGLARFWATGKAGSISPNLTKRVRDRLDTLDAAKVVQDLQRSGYRLHEWKGHPGWWSIDVNGPWRILFRFHNGDAYDVDLQQPH
jgi:proteic killer suppression protein